MHPCLEKNEAFYVDETNSLLLAAFWRGLQYILIDIFMANM